MIADKEKPILIVGAGVSGLQAARALLKRGFQVVLLEQSEDVGGVWIRNYQGYGLQVPWELYQFPEFPYPRKSGLSEYPSGEAVRDYVQAYARHFDLYRHILFSCRLVSLRRKQTRRPAGPSDAVPTAARAPYCMHSAGAAARAQMPDARCSMGEGSTDAEGIGLGMDCSPSIHQEARGARGGGSAGGDGSSARPGAAIPSHLLMSSTSRLRQVLNFMTQGTSGVGGNPGADSGANSCSNSRRNNARGSVLGVGDGGAGTGSSGAAAGGGCSGPFDLSMDMNRGGSTTQQVQRTFGRAYGVGTAAGGAGEGTGARGIGRRKGSLLGLRQAAPLGPAGTPVGGQGPGPDDSELCRSSSGVDLSGSGSLAQVDEHGQLEAGDGAGAAGPATAGPRHPKATATAAARIAGPVAEGAEGTREGGGGWEGAQAPPRRPSAPQVPTGCSGAEAGRPAGLVAQQHIGVSQQGAGGPRLGPVSAEGPGVAGAAAAAATTQPCRQQQGQGNGQGQTRGQASGWKGQEPAVGATGALGEWGCWEAVYEDSCTGRQYVLDASYVVLCTGLYATPFIPNIPGQALYRGLQVHSRDFTDAAVASGKRVLVVGAGKTAVDVITELTATSAAASVTLLYRRPHWPLPRFVGPVSIKLLAYTRLLSRALLPHYYDAGPGERLAAACLTPLRKAFWVRFMGRVNKALGVKKTLGTPSRPICQDIWYSGQVLDAVKWPVVIHNPKVQAIQGEVDHFTPVSAVLQDGTELEPDIVLYATGYSNHYTFLEPEVRQALDVQHDGLYLYRHCLVPGLEGLAFVGAEVSTFNNILTAALQAEWLAAVLTGEVALPGPAAMTADVAAQRVWRRRTMPPHKLRGSAVMLYMQSYHDQLLRDMGLPTHRKRPTWRHPLAECLEPYTAEDYTDMFKQSPAGQQRGVLAGARPASPAAHAAATTAVLAGAGAGAGQPMAAAGLSVVGSGSVPEDVLTPAERLGRAAEMEVLQPGQGDKRGVVRAPSAAAAAATGGAAPFVPGRGPREAACRDGQPCMDTTTTTAITTANISAAGAAAAAGAGVDVGGSISRLRGESNAGWQANSSPRNTVVGRFLHSAAAALAGGGAGGGGSGSSRSLSFRLSQAPGLGGFSSTGPERRPMGFGKSTSLGASAEGYRQTEGDGRAAAAAGNGGGANAVASTVGGGGGGTVAEAEAAEVAAVGDARLAGSAAIRRPARSGGARMQGQPARATAAGVTATATAAAAAAATAGAYARPGSPSEACSPFLTTQQQQQHHHQQQHQQQTLLLLQQRPQPGQDGLARVGSGGFPGTAAEDPRVAPRPGHVAAGGGGGGDDAPDPYDSQEDLDEQDTLYSLDALPPALQAYRRTRMRVGGPGASMANSTAPYDQEAAYLYGTNSSSIGGIAVAARGAADNITRVSAPGAVIRSSTAVPPGASVLSPGSTRPSLRSPAPAQPLSASLQRTLTTVLRRERSETASGAAGGTASAGGARTGTRAPAAADGDGGGGCRGLPQGTVGSPASPGNGAVTRTTTWTGIIMPGRLSSARPSFGGHAAIRKMLGTQGSIGTTMAAAGGSNDATASGSLPRGSCMGLGYPVPEHRASASAGGSATALGAAVSGPTPASRALPMVVAADGGAGTGPRAFPTSSLGGMVLGQVNNAPVSGSLPSGSSDSGSSSAAAGAKGPRQRRGVRRGFSLAALLMRSRANNSVYDITSSRIEPSSSAVAELAYKVLPPKHVEEAMAAAAAAARRRKSADGPQLAAHAPPGVPAAAALPPPPAVCGPGPTSAPQLLCVRGQPSPRTGPNAPLTQARQQQGRTPPASPPAQLAGALPPSGTVPVHQVSGASVAKSTAVTSLFSKEMAMSQPQPQPPRLAPPSSPDAPYGRYGNRASGGGGVAPAAPRSASSSSGISYVPSGSTVSFPQCPDAWGAGAAATAMAANQATMYVDQTHRMPYNASAAGTSVRDSAGGAVVPPPPGSSSAASDYAAVAAPGGGGGGAPPRGVYLAHTAGLPVSAVGVPGRMGVSGGTAAPVPGALAGSARFGFGSDRPCPDGNGGRDGGGGGGGGGGRRAGAGGFPPGSLWVVHGPAGGGLRRSSSDGFADGRSSSGSSSSGVSYVPTCSTVIAPQLLRVEE